MDVKAFKKPSGKLIDAPYGEYKYFMPNPPPSHIQMDEKLTFTLSEASANLGKLSGAGELLPNPHILISPYIAKEAVLSSKIEGTQASLSDVMKYSVSKETEKDARDIEEVINYLKALQYGLKYIKKRDIDLKLISEMHGILLKNVRGENKNPGEFRKVQNWIGRRGTNLGNATFIPPAAEVLEGPLYDFISYITKKNIPILIQAALMHHHFEVIHPFRDGNGRIGRVLITLFLCKRGSLSEPLLYLSSYFERNRTEYYRRLLEVSQESKYEEWVNFFLKGVKELSIDSLQRVRKLTVLREKYIDILTRRRSVQNSIRALDILFSNPYTSVTDLQEKLDLTYPTAKKAIEYLEKYNIVREITGKERYKVYCATEIIDIIEL
jgi:Fic family protein